MKYLPECASFIKFADEMRNPFGTSAEMPVEAAQHIFHLHCILTIDQDESPINFVLKVSAITSGNECNSVYVVPQ